MHDAMVTIFTILCRVQATRPSAPEPRSKLDLMKFRWLRQGSVQYTTNTPMAVLHIVKPKGIKTRDFRAT